MTAGSATRIAWRVIVARVGGSARASHPGPSDGSSGSTEVVPRRLRRGGWSQAAFVLVAFLVAGSGALAAGCGSEDADEPVQSVSTDAVLTALVDWAVGGDAAPTADENPPVVYITASNGDTIDAAVQASVVESTADDATVRFADDRSEAIDDTTDDQRCHDDGVLLVVGELPADGTPSAMTVERYRAVDDATIFDVTLAPDGDGAAVTGATAE
jgi:hypothetical protein